MRMYQNERQLDFHALIREIKRKSGLVAACENLLVLVKKRSANQTSRFCTASKRQSMCKSRDSDHTAITCFICLRHRLV